MNTLAPSFLIGSTSFLQVTRTCIKAWMSSNFGQIPPLTPELSALARLKNGCEHSSAYIFDWIFFIFSGNEENQQVWTEFEFWPNGTKGYRVIALDRCQKLVFAQYLENGWTELTKFCIHYIIDKSMLLLWGVIFCKSAPELHPLIDIISEIGFCSIS